MNELERLREAHAAIKPPAAHVVGGAREQLLAAHAEDPVAPPAPRFRRRWLRRSTAIAVIAVASVVAVALWPGRASNPTAPTPAFAARACLQSGSGSAGACLDALGELAAADDVLAAGEVFYRRDLWAQSIMYIGPRGRPQLGPRGPGVFGIVRAGHQELWVAPDRSGRLQFGHAQQPYLPSLADERAWRAAGRPDIKRLAGRTDRRDDLPPRSFGPGELDDVLLGGTLSEALPDTDPLRNLPHDPEKLSRELYRIAWFQRVQISGDPGCAAGLQHCVATTRRSIDSVYGSNITTLLRYPFAAPELRRALLQVLGDIPGAKKMGAIQDPAERRGAAILLPDPFNDGRNVVVFDLATGRLLADGRANKRTRATLRWNNIYDLEVAGVDAIGKRPD